MLQIVGPPGPDAIDEKMLTDAQLLALLARGETWALSELHARYARLVFSIARQTLNDPSGAEEIVQQVFMDVWRHASHYRRERGTFSAWVGTITRHQCIDELRRRRVRPLTAAGDWESLEGPGEDEDPAQQVQDILEQARIREGLQTIPAGERTVIELAYWGGMTHREIARHCHFPLGTVKTRLRLGMRRLKSFMQEAV